MHKIIATHFNLDHIRKEMTQEEIDAIEAEQQIWLDDSVIREREYIKQHRNAEICRVTNLKTALINVLTTEQKIACDAYVANLEGILEDDYTSFDAVQWPIDPDA